MWSNFMIRKVVNGAEGLEGGLGCSATENLPGVGVERRLIPQISRSAALVGKLAARRAQRPMNNCVEKRAFLFVSAFLGYDASILINHR